MNYRKFGRTELMVSEIGFGAWAIGGNALVGNTPIGWGPANDMDSAAAIKRSLDRGINFFDTADFYGLGHSEELLGKYLGKLDEIWIATKVGHRAINNTIQLDYSKVYIIKACHESLRRLKRDEIDYYQLHSARMEHLRGDCVEAMEQLVKEGKVRYWGLSLNTFKPFPESVFLMDAKKGNGFQLVFNLINQLGWPIIEQAGEKGYGIIARMPLQFGLLTGKFHSKSKFGKDDHRNFRLSKDIIERSNEILENKIWGLCDKYSCSKVTLALSFILSFPEVSTVIPGIRNAAQAEENTEPLVTLEMSDREFLSSLFQSEWKEIVLLMEEKG